MFKSYITQKQTTYINQMKRTSADNGVNLVIFDADDDYDKKRNELVKWKDQNNLDFQLFLFPDNNSSGELEDLLENIINPENKPVMDCWKTYEDSLKKLICLGEMVSPLPYRQKDKDICLFGSIVRDI